MWLSKRNRVTDDQAIAYSQLRKTTVVSLELLRMELLPKCEIYAGQKLEEHNRRIKHTEYLISTIKKFPDIDQLRHMAQTDLHLMMTVLYTAMLVADAEHVEQNRDTSDPSHAITDR